MTKHDNYTWSAFVCLSTSISLHASTSWLAILISNGDSVSPFSCLCSKISDDPGYLSDAGLDCLNAADGVPDSHFCCERRMISQNFVHRGDF